MSRIAMVLGATGLVGKAVTQELLSRGAWDEIRVLVRRPIGIKHPLLKQTIVDWEQLPRYREQFRGVQVMFCCLGTTIKTAGSQSSFERVDLRYPLEAAAIAKEEGVGQLLAVSSIGADAKSRNFYSRTKGRAEEGLIATGFHGLHLFRPSLLLGQRKEFRLGERVAARLMTALDFAMVGQAAKYRAIHGETVARAMVNISLAGTAGLHIYPNDVIHVIGKG
ncbi:nucleoside-diphosphate sugar epimerase [Bacillus sp. FJAT-27264]|uniref:NAD(P)H-binding protein n=1 Tax=Paenibacillus sp. (strain DSM 101736 / FJAT-27264) TaxID=1850362 RepID=UPI000807B34C|nr:NAD(P)H-binding protein [Bacillus sp. FJAT-27264]OBZ10802.1 nucleoside-diphosphate sugar epimerase [Bacillus sp. FJAT-27264]